MSEPMFVGKICRDYELIEQIDDSHWKCRCLKCGLERDYSIQTLKLPRENSCVCTCTRSGVKIGDRYDRLVAIKRDLSRVGKGQVYWLWQCDCGNIVSLPLKQIKNGNNSSCGCKQRESRLVNCKIGYEKSLIDLTGQRFGKLVALRMLTDEEAEGRPKANKYWKCQCDCGNTHIVSTSNLRSKSGTRSCGCVHSLGEQTIATMLNKNGIIFAKEFTFSNCLSEKGYPYRFDFAIFKNNTLDYLIEFDGEQHYDIHSQFNADNPEESLKKIQMADKNKNDYCFKNNIPLIRIPYNHLHKLNIDDLKIESSTFIVN